MRQILVCFYFFILSCNTFSQQVDGEFRSDFRPQYNKTVSVEELSQIQSDENVLILDVRLVEDFESNPVLIPGAEYRNPELISGWLSKLDQSKEVVVYCAGGKWVSQKVAFLLDQSGVSVRNLDGGLNAWLDEAD